MTPKPIPPDAGIHPQCGFPFCECKEHCSEQAIQKMVYTSQDWGLYDPEDDLK